MACRNGEANIGMDARVIRPNGRQPARWRAACIEIGRRADQPAFQPPPSFTSTTLSPTLASLPL